MGNKRSWPVVEFLARPCRQQKGLGSTGTMPASRVRCIIRTEEPPGGRGTCFSDQLAKTRLKAGRDALACRKTIESNVAKVMSWLISKWGSHNLYRQNALYSDIFHMALSYPSTYVWRSSWYHLTVVTSFPPNFTRKVVAWACRCRVRDGCHRNLRKHIR